VVGSEQRGEVVTLHPAGTGIRRRQTERRSAIAGVERNVDTPSPDRAATWPEWADDARRPRALVVFAESDRDRPVCTRIHDTRWETPFTFTFPRRCRACQWRSGTDKRRFC